MQIRVLLSFDGYLIVNQEINTVPGLLSQVHPTLAPCDQKRFLPVSVKSVPSILCPKGLLEVGRVGDILIC